ncbi:hypothetical protein [Loktanella sp. Alg231-35]|uniref:hypothetical protein n=1 Tax=Loktanella sp. Alg231-35 TaxID=1922220 RepID=UPI00131EE7A4|nr:hypothetical protein [Loktanella sp. Alg231-35]
MKDAEITDCPDLAEAMNKAASAGHGSRLEIDLDHYQNYLDDPALTSDQKEDIVGALWMIITAFVELGFGVHPTQQACGKPETPLDLTAKSESTKPKQDKKNPDTDAPVI